VQAFLDDVGVVGMPGDVCSFAKALEKEYEKIGLRVNWQKSYAHPEISGFLADKQSSSSSSSSSTTTLFLGAAVDPDESPQRSLADDDMAEPRTLLREIPCLPDPRAALLMLKHVIGSNGTYAFRTTPPRKTQQLARDMEEHIARAVAAILRRTDLPHRSVLLLATFAPPVGLGLPNPVITAPHAFAASLLEALAPLSIRRAIPLASQTFCESAFCKDLSAAAALAGLTMDEFMRNGVRAAKGGRMRLQGEMVAKEKDKIMADLLSNTLPEGLKERVMARNGSAAAGAWLQAPVSCDFQMSPVHATVAMSLWLGLAPPGAEGRKCLCGSAIDGDGHHLLVCPHGAGPARRHAAVQRILAEALNAAGCAVRTEKQVAQQQQGQVHSLQTSLSPTLPLATS